MRHLSLLLLLLPLLAGCGEDTPGPDPPAVPIPAGFPPMPVPANNALTAERIALGKRLFYDRQLSRTREVSCGSCHLPDRAFAEPLATSVGVEGRHGERNAPMLANLGWNTSFFWDGGVPTLEQQAIAPILNPLEMDMTVAELVSRVSADPEYVEAFRAAYGGEPSVDNITRALASFVRSLVSGNSRFDRYQNGDTAAMTAQELHGRDLFLSEKADCFHCHLGFNFTTNGFANNGMFASYPDSGRARITENPRDRGRFKIPSLRNVALTAPYMHNGEIATLREVVERYNAGGLGHANSDPLIVPLHMTDEEVDAVVAFLRTLTDEEFTANPKHRQ